MYVAQMYTRICGKTYTRGEIIQEDLPEEKKAWLLGAGAIKEIAPAPSALADDVKTPPEPPKNPQPPEENADEEEDGEADTESAATKDAEDEIDEDAEIPEIDVMDGLVAEDEQPEPEKETAARKTAKNIAGRRTNK